MSVLLPRHHFDKLPYPKQIVTGIVKIKSCVKDETDIKIANWEELLTIVM